MNNLAIHNLIGQIGELRTVLRATTGTDHDLIVLACERGTKDVYVMVACESHEAHRGMAQVLAHQVLEKEHAHGPLQ